MTKLTSSLKFCRCCGSKAYGLKRVCKRCGVPAIWDKANAEQLAEEAQEIAQKIALFERVLRESEA